MVWEGWGGGGVVPWRAHVHLVQVIPVVFSPTFLNFFLIFFSPRCSTPSSCSPCPPPGQASTSTQYRDNPGHRVSDKELWQPVTYLWSDKNSIARLWNGKLGKQWDKRR